MDKTKGELLQEELLFKQENGTTRLSDEEIDKAYAFAEDYKKFMDAAKIEIEAVKEAIKLLEANGYHEFERGRKYLPGERFYYNNRGYTSNRKRRKDPGCSRRFSKTGPQTKPTV